MEDEFYNLVVKGNDLKTYIRRFQELAVLCPNMTLEEATNIAYRLMDQIIKRNSVQETNDHKRKFDDKRNTTTNNNNYPDNRNNNSRNNDYHQQQKGNQETFKANVNHGYNGPHPLCRKCTLHHTGPRTVRCQNCNKVGHQTRNCRS
ncbi:reverse transcriptase domain-containing protein [Tanacetum coccineum]